MSADPAPHVLDAEEGEAFWFFGGLVTVKASALQLGGRYALTEHLYPGGVATPLHSQPEESLYVLDGELTFCLEDGQPMPASAGSFVHVPAGAVHAYQVDSETARILKSPPPNTNASSLGWPPCHAQGSADRVDQERDFQRRRERFLHRLREGRGEG